MADTTFVDYQTPVPAAWLNDVNDRVYQRTAGEIASGVTPTTYVYPEGDIRRYGASTSASDNSTAINNALLVSANGGLPAYIPPGTWAYTTTLSATLGCSMYGDGQYSILAPNGVHGITFTTQGTYRGSRFFRNFALVATSGTAVSGIYGTMTAASGNRVTGIVFDNVSIENFQYGINIQGFWNCTWRECFLYNNYQGIQLTQRNIKCTFINVHQTIGTITGTGDQYAFYAGEDGGVRSEDIVIQNCFFYGYDYGAYIDNALYVAINGTDFDHCEITGVNLVTVNGGCTVRDCWINTNASFATKGIRVAPLASPNADKIVLDGNNITCSVPTAGSIGIEVGDEQNGGVTVTNNRVYDFETGIKSAAADNTIIKYNSIDATSVAINIDTNSSANEVGPNYIEAGTELTYSAGTPPLFKYYAKGSFTATLTGMSGSTTGTVNWAAQGAEVVLTIDSAITGTSNTTAMTMTGLPTYLRPNNARTTTATITDNGTTALGHLAIGTDGVFTFGTALGATGSFTGSGTKGLAASILSYTI